MITWFHQLKSKIKRNSEMEDLKNEKGSLPALRKWSKEADLQKKQSREMNEIEQKQEKKNADLKFLGSSK